MQRLIVHCIYIYSQVYIAHPGSATIDCNARRSPILVHDSEDEEAMWSQLGVAKNGDFRVRCCILILECPHCRIFEANSSACLSICFDMAVHGHSGWPFLKHGMADQRLAADLGAQSSCKVRPQGGGLWRLWSRTLWISKTCGAQPSKFAGLTGVA